MPAPVVGGLVAVVLYYIGRLIFAKIMLALGVGILTFWGFLEVTESLQETVIERYQGLPADLLILLDISGITDCLGIILTALSIRATIIFAPRMGVLWSALSD